MTAECHMCRRLPICPICSQVRSESTNDKCPVNITPNEISKNIQEYFSDLFYQQNNETLSK